jgi:hypothetical protein
MLVERRLVGACAAAKLEFDTRFAAARVGKLITLAEELCGVRPCAANMFAVVLGFASTIEAGAWGSMFARDAFCAAGSGD